MHIPSKSVTAAAIALTLACLSITSFAQGTPISTPYLIGTWQENQQCQARESMVVFPNGTISLPGAPPVNYTVTGPAHITIHGAGGAAPFGVQYVNQNQMILSVQNQSSVMYRCGSNSGWQPQPQPQMQPRQQQYVQQISKGDITGPWGLNGNCANVEVFGGNGIFAANGGAVSATWQLQGNTIRLINPNGLVVDFAVQMNGKRNMTLTQLSNNQVSSYTRCF